MQCTKCGRHKFIVTTEVDKKTNKKWFIRRCSVCEHPNEIMDYKLTVLRDIKNLDPELMEFTDED